MMTSDNGRAARDGGTRDAVIDIAFAFWRATLLLSADELGVFAALRDVPVDASTIQTRLGLNVESSDDFLAALDALGMIERCAGGYRNSATSARYLDPAAPDYLGAWLAMARAAQQETVGMTGKLRGAPCDGTRDTDLNARMREEITAILAAETRD
jgi:N,N-dimethyltransferase/O-methyltransferase